MKCHRCARQFSGPAPAYPVQLWGIFRIPARGLVVEPSGAISRRCRHCGWINVFDRMDGGTWRDFELKQAAS